MAFSSPFSITGASSNQSFGTNANTGANAQAGENTTKSTSNNIVGNPQPSVLATASNPSLGAITNSTLFTTSANAQLAAPAAVSTAVSKPATSTLPTVSTVPSNAQIQTSSANAQFQYISPSGSVYYYSIPGVSASTVNNALAGTSSVSGATQVVSNLASLAPGQVANTIPLTPAQATELAFSQSPYNSVSLANSANTAVLTPSGEQNLANFYKSESPGQNITVSPSGLVSVLPTASQAIAPTSQYEGAGLYSVNGRQIYFTSQAAFNSYVSGLSNPLIGYYTTQPTLPVAPGGTYTLAGQTYTYQQFVDAINSATPISVAAPSVVSPPLTLQQAAQYFVTFGDIPSSIPGSAQIVLPQGWTTNSQGDVFVNGQPPTFQQAEQYANALIAFRESPYAPEVPASAAASPSSYVPNWYGLLQSTPQGGIVTANLAANGINPDFAQFAAQYGYNYQTGVLSNPPSVGQAAPNARTSGFAYSGLVNALSPAEQTLLSALQQGAYAASGTASSLAGKVRVPQGSSTQSITNLRQNRSSPAIPQTASFRPGITEQFSGTYPSNQINGLSTDINNLLSAPFDLFNSPQYQLNQQANAAIANYLVNNPEVNSNFFTNLGLRLGLGTPAFLQNAYAQVSNPLIGAYNYLPKQLQIYGPAAPPTPYAPSSLSNLLTQPIGNPIGITGLAQSGNPYISFAGQLAQYPFQQAASLGMSGRSPIQTIQSLLTIGALGSPEALSAALKLGAEFGILNEVGNAVANIVLGNPVLQNLGTNLQQGAEFGFTTSPIITPLEAAVTPLIQSSDLLSRFAQLPAYARYSVEAPVSAAANVGLTNVLGALTGQAVTPEEDIRSAVVGATYPVTGDIVANYGPRIQEMPGQGVSSTALNFKLGEENEPLTLATFTRAGGGETGVPAEYRVGLGRGGTGGYSVSLNDIYNNLTSSVGALAEAVGIPETTIKTVLEGAKAIPSSVNDALGVSVALQNINLATATQQAAVAEIARNFSEGLQSSPFLVAQAFGVPEEALDNIYQNLKAIPSAAYQQALGIPQNLVQGIQAIPEAYGIPEAYNALLGSDLYRNLAEFQRDLAGGIRETPIEVARAFGVPESVLRNAYEGLVNAPRAVAEQLYPENLAAGIRAAPLEITRALGIPDELLRNIYEGTRAIPSTISELYSPRLLHNAITGSEEYQTLAGIPRNAYLGIQRAPLEVARAFGIPEETLRDIYGGARAIPSTVAEGFGIPYKNIVAEEFLNPRLTEQGNPIALFNTVKNDASATPEGASSDLLTTPYGRSILRQFYKDISTVRPEIADYGEASLKMQDIIKGVNIPRTSVLKLNIEGLSEEQNEFLADLMRKYASEISEGGFRGSSANVAQMGEAFGRVPKDIDLTFKTEEAATNFVKEAQQGLNNLGGQFRIDPDKPTSLLTSDGNGHIIDGKVKEQTYGGYARQGERPLGAPKEEPTEIEGVSTQSIYGSISDKLASDLGFRVLTKDYLDSLKEDAEGFRDYLQKQLDEAQRLQNAKAEGVRTTEPKIEYGKLKPENDEVARDPFVKSNSAGIAGSGSAVAGLKNGEFRPENDLETYVQQQANMEPVANRIADIREEQQVRKGLSQADAEKSVDVQMNQDTRDGTIYQIQVYVDGKLTDDIVFRPAENPEKYFNEIRGVKSLSSSVEPDRFIEVNGIKIRDPLQVLRDKEEILRDNPDLDALRLQKITKDLEYQERLLEMKQKGEFGVITNPEQAQALETKVNELRRPSQELGARIAKTEKAQTDVELIQNALRQQEADIAEINRLEAEIARIKGEDVLISTIAPNTWRVKDIVDPIAQARYVSQFILNPIAKQQLLSAIDDYITGAKALFGITDEQIAQGQVDVPSALKGNEQQVAADSLSRTITKLTKGDALAVASRISEISPAPQDALSTLFQSVPGSEEFSDALSKVPASAAASVLRSLYNSGYISQAQYQSYLAYLESPYSAYASASGYAPSGYSTAYPSSSYASAYGSSSPSPAYASPSPYLYASPSPYYPSPYGVPGSPYKNPYLGLVPSEPAFAKTPIKLQKGRSRNRPIYSASLLPFIFPELEARLERENYAPNPLTLISGTRPIKLPEGNTLGYEEERLPGSNRIIRLAPPIQKEEVMV